MPCDNTVMHIREMYCLFWIVFILDFVKDSFPLDVTSPALVTEIEGARCLLKCNYFNQNPSDTMFVVLWQKVNETTRQSVTILNSQTFREDGKFSPNNRLDLIGLASLQIDPVLWTDSGTYRCQVIPFPSFHQGETLINLQVNYPPKFKIPEETTLYLSNGDQVILPCHAKAKPNDIFYAWYYQPLNGKEEFLNIRNYRQLDHETGKTLRIAFRGDIEGRLRCEANNTIGSSSVVTHLVLKKPARFTSILCNNYTVAEGDDVRIEVEAAGVPNNLTFKWFYEGIPISMYKRSSVLAINNNATTPDLSITYNNSLSRLNIKRIDRRSSGTYTCKVHNEVGDPDATNLTLTVHYPAVFERVPFSSYVVMERDSIILPCSGHGNPPPVVNWKIPHFDLFSFNASAPTRHHILENGFLSVGPVLRSDSGKFICEISNGVGLPKIASTELKVEYLPEISRPFQTIYHVLKGDNFSVPCLASGFPAPHITWYRNLTELQAQESNESNNLTLSKVNYFDGGEYRCQAENRHGMAFISVELFVLYAPYIVHLPSFRYLYVGDDVNITCLVSGFPLPEIKWTQTTNNSMVPLNVQSDTNSRTYIVKNFENSTFVQSILMKRKVRLRESGVYFCTAQNYLGKIQSEVNLLIKNSDYFPVLSNLTIYEVTENRIILCWSYQASDNSLSYSGLLGTIHCELWNNVTDKQPRAIECSSQNCTIENLNASTIYRLLLIYKGFRGRNRELFKLMVTTKDPSSSAPTVFATSASKSLHAKTYQEKNQTEELWKNFAAQVLHETESLCLNMRRYNSVQLQQYTSRNKRDITVNKINRTSNYYSYTCYKVEGYNETRALWTVIAQCLSRATEICQLIDSVTHFPRVKIMACHHINNVCLQPLEFKLINMHYEASDPRLVTSQSNRNYDWLSFIVPSGIALLLVTALYMLARVFALRTTNTRENSDLETSVFPRRRVYFSDDLMVQEESPEVDTNFRYNKFDKVNKSWALPEVKSATL